MTGVFISLPRNRKLPQNHCLTGCGQAIACLTGVCSQCYSRRDFEEKGVLTKVFCDCGKTYELRQGDLATEIVHPNLACCEPGWPSIMLVRACEACDPNLQFDKVQAEWIKIRWKD